jgi:hypothetical protein
MPDPIVICSLGNARDLLAVTCSGCDESRSPPLPRKHQPSEDTKMPDKTTRALTFFLRSNFSNEELEVYSRGIAETMTAALSPGEPVTYSVGEVASRDRAFHPADDDTKNVIGESPESAGAVTHRRKKSE